MLKRCLLKFARGAILAILVSSMVGCSEKPADEARQNRRLVDAVLTAVTTRNRKELRRDANLWNERLASGLVGKEFHGAVSQAIAKASGGDWSGAEEDLYRFRETEPFPD
ncbi:MAG: hypothetical protein U0836_24095 [Pirellulales bacterium]